MRWVAAISCRLVDPHAIRLLVPPLLLLLPLICHLVCIPKSNKAIIPSTRNQARHCCAPSHRCDTSCVLQPPRQMPIHLPHIPKHNRAILSASDQPPTPNPTHATAAACATAGIASTAAAAPRLERYRERLPSMRLHHANRRGAGRHVGVRDDQPPITPHCGEDGAAAVPICCIGPAALVSVRPALQVQGFRF